MTTPSSAYLTVALLVKSHQETVSVLVVGYKVLEVNGTFPIAVFVTEVMVVATRSICPIHVCSNGVVVEVAVVGNYGDDGQIIVFVGIDVTACDDSTGQVTILIKA